MSLRTDQSPETLALDAAVAANRRGEPVPLAPDADLPAFAATQNSGTLTSVVRLSTRAPWFDGLAAMYAFNCSRWDSPAELAYCVPNQQPEGEGWDGTVLYFDFTAPAAGDYVIVASVHGSNSIVHLRGPWGLVKKKMPLGQDHQLIGATWTGAGELSFTITFSGQWLGSISAVQIFQVS